MEDLYKLFNVYAGSEPEKIIALAGAGSNRKYYRLHGGGRSVIGVVGTDIQENEAYFCVSEQFFKWGIPIPEIYAISNDSMTYLIEDLGDTLLSDKVEAANKAGEYDEKTVALLCRTMKWLPRIQFEGAENFDFNNCYPQPSFDRQNVMFDLNYFKYCFLKPSGVEFNEVLLQNDFEKLADNLLAEDFNTFMYRDFNARNVMVKNDAPYFIDFQGGRRGPIYYDVASFVFQARANYPYWLKDKMITAYLDTLSDYIRIDRQHFESKLQLFVFFRTLQVLGAYGYRGLIEHKAKFVVSIPQALENLKDIISSRDLGTAYPYLCKTLTQVVQLQRFAPAAQDGVLEVKVYSFSYKKGIPEDLTGNGGGYIFDCRSIHNPGRYEPYRQLTGRDAEVIKFLEDDGEILEYLDHIYSIVDPHVYTYCRRGFTHLMVGFGCTGGQHRSVYCAEHLANHLATKFPNIRVKLIHREHP